ncbi:hypothetical protein B9479_000186 [Cryptococcus floricola]|uniref:Cystathionine gamma-synthase n=1 Tax=Cryptococcus floricola TaxID=2591691 RepID=A0A5D3B6F6_9TREE|nr:hypothetical protein B9479_000186 [Cryptococcus floricola]
MPIRPPSPISLGAALPAHTDHPVSMSIPTWDELFRYQEGDEVVCGSMKSGYPRMFFHRYIQKIASICVDRFGNPDEDLCLMLPSPRVAQEGQAYLLRQSLPIQSRTVPFSVAPEVEIQVLLYPKDNLVEAKAFWQLTGDGISSRFAEMVMGILGEELSSVEEKSEEKYLKDQEVTPELVSDLEGLKGKSLPLLEGRLAKKALKGRIARGLSPDDARPRALTAGLSSSKPISEEDVYLYPTGMSAVWHCHDMIRRARKGNVAEGKSVCYSFPYKDTLRVLNQFGSGCHFLGAGGTADIPALEAILENQSKDPSQAPILALVTEVPSNPLLRSPDLARLRELADQYKFVLVIDETIGNFVNVEVMPYADVVVSSLTKIFSGSGDVMGGGLILNPNSPHYADLRAAQETSFEDLFFSRDATRLEYSSRDYVSRIIEVDNNTFDITTYLQSRSLADGSTPEDGKVIKTVYYPRYIAPTTYSQSQRFPTLSKGGFGHLFSLTFTSLAASRAFYDNLDCLKGPSLGTNFTLAAPFTVLAHYSEMDWTEEWGVERGLIRVSVGQEDISHLRSAFEKAVKAAEAAEEAGRT